MKLFSFIFILFLFPCVSKAMKSPDMPVKFWHLGEAHLSNGEKIKGKIYYEIEKELLLIFNKGQIKTYSSNQIDKFLIIDKETGLERLFYSIPIPLGGATRRNYFFEIMTEGEIVYLRKQRMRTDGFGLFVFDESQLANYSGYFNYYFFINDNLVRVKRFRKEALNLMADHRDRMDIFIEKNGLQLNKIKDQVMLLKYYNSLCEGETITVNDRW